ncbi:MAG TPA: response regulator [Acidobacteriaceae bacterium]|jgi:FixJ family two-component response regulator|nr:response regulator [Acidobacteriaceae bacterium]
MNKGLISVVDDDESVRRTTTFLIESFGFRSAAFASAEAFLGSGQLQDTSCLIADVQMPGMTGLRLQSELAATGHNIPVIFITAFDNRDSRQQAMHAGAVAFLGKPFNDQELLECIRLALAEGLEARTDLIVVVDDDESIRRTTTLLIESFGLRAAAFDSAESFLQSGQQHTTSCLILDVRMPSMGGLQLQSELAATGRSIPVIFITAYDDKESRGRATQAGAVAFLSKPFSDEQLLQSIRSALGRHTGSTTSM